MDHCAKGRDYPDPGVPYYAQCRGGMEPRGRDAIRVYNIYGDAAGSAKAIQGTRGLTVSCIENAEGAGRVPALVAGDFNAEVHQLQLDTEGLAGGWRDVGTGPTCRAPNAISPSRIDLLLANRQTQWKVNSVDTHFSVDIKTHAIQSLELEISRPSKTRRWKQAETIDPKQAVASREEAAKAAKMQCEAVCRWADTMPIDALYAALEEALGAYWEARMGEEAKIGERQGK